MTRNNKIIISLAKRYENFKKTIQECGSYLLSENDDVIKYNLFEEFSVDVISFCIMIHWSFFGWRNDR